MTQQYTPARAMFIYAHPDDIEFGVAGTAAKWAKNGSDVTYVVITDGNVGSHDPTLTQEKLAEVRRAEQSAAATVAGAARCLFLGHHDGLLEPTLALRQELVKLIRTYKPNAVVCGDPTMYFRGDRINHPDHRAAAKAAIDAVFPASEMHLLYPDLLAEGLGSHKVNYVYISTIEGANYYVDITDTIDVKLNALRQHVSQLDGWDPDERIRTWNADLGKKVGFAYAEVYRRMTVHEPEPPAISQQ